ncbi:Neuropeptide FF receptor [Apis cerana cerana]|uniref:Neuropeptide FF receptor n=1 Tax=Apis cerana cerana TaxID=94128 RepID=A0A2A3E9B6_APICC|nr:Neuropeptide FF receptor [Apis cerana cerana]
MSFLNLWNKSFMLDIQWNYHIENNYDFTSANLEWENIDTSKYIFPREIWEIRPMWEIIVKIISILPIIIIGSFANGGLIYVILKEKSLHTTTNLLIVNMCIADLEIGCRLDGSLVHALTLVAVFNLSAISYDRVSAIVLNCSGKLTKRQWKNYLETYCTEDTVLIYPYWHIFAGLSVWAPLTIMAICYTAIFIKLDRYESQALKNKYPIVVKYKGKVTQILALIVVAFIICRVPFTALIIRRAQLLKETPKTGQAETIYPLWYISRYLVLVNAAINPLLYGCSSSSLRKKLMLCSVTSWLMQKKKQKVLKTYRNTIPQISSTII